ncbi:hypothetical protein EJ04DRAFT_545961 [Polyplosphaeria fusca]|uniref:DUF3176 domain containing protein n=1 Tax=Polyplosphaeria fusca TaxID=682080 RepID=A0A9P4QSH4_9PLEO|nr:hypothetical protein EJ04DRAFT_545961 [Polyplosphaeria fusca]
MTTYSSPERRHTNFSSHPWSRSHQSPSQYNQDPPYSPSSATINVHDDHSHPPLPYSHAVQQGSSVAPGVSAQHSHQDKPPLLRASTTFYERVLTDWWWWEIFSFLVSFCSVAAIVGVLWFYDGKPQPKFIVPGITLNAYVSVFSAIAKAALILPVSEAIGQLKWMWFEKEAKLWDFFTFDSASRGPWGSLMLLGTTRCRHLVSLGALVTILALAFEPFFQQIVSFSSRDVAQSNSTVNIATTYNPDGDRKYVVDTDYNTNGLRPGRSMVLAANSYVSSNQSTNPFQAGCSTGRCNWTNYNSLGVCHTCQEISNALHQSGILTNPCGYTLNGTFMSGQYYRNYERTIALSTVVTGDRAKIAFNDTWNSTIFGDAVNPIVDFYVGYTPGGDPQLRQNATPVLLECLFSWCVKTFESSYENGSLREKLVSTFSEQNIVPGTSQNETGGVSYSITVNGTSFIIPPNTTDILYDAIRSGLPLFLGNRYTSSTGALPGIWNFVQQAPYDLNPYFEKLTEVMTNNIRSQLNSTEIILGTAWASENFVEIRWAWISLPAALLFGTLVFVGVTVFQSRTRKLPAWKSSSLATLLHGLTEEAWGTFDSRATPSEIEALSRRLRVMLDAQSESARLKVA